MANPLWRIEESLWTGGADCYAEFIDLDCLMAFPRPAGIMKRDAILKGIEEAPRWVDIEMADRTQTKPKEDVAVLAYRATARRSKEDVVYTAICTSVYALRDNGSRMVQHQQTPIADASV